MGFSFWGIPARFGEVNLLRRTAKRVLHMGLLALLCACVSLASARSQDNSTGSAAKKSTSSASAQKKQTTHSASASQNASTKTGAHSSASKSKSGTVHISGKRSLKRTKGKRVRGQQKIDSERAHSIQEALIREHYLSGEPSGTWNQESEDAMRRYQGDNGWQTKEVPDSRALIKLGLGPSKDHLLNPESAMTTVPDTRTDPPRAATSAPTSHSATPAASTPVATPVQTDSPSPQ